MNNIKHNKETQKENLIRKLNEELVKDIKKIFEKQDEIYKLGDILKYQGIEDIKPGEIHFTKKPLGYDGKYHLYSKVDGLCHLHHDYKEEFVNFYTKYNRRNPFRIEITFEKESAPEGTLVNSFGKWIMTPYMKKEAKVLKGFLENIDFPRYAVVAFRPEKINKQEGIISRLKDDIEYEPTHIRFGNELKIKEYAELVISIYEQTRFTHIGISKDEILNKWGFLIPFLDKSF